MTAKKASGVADAVRDLGKAKPQKGRATKKAPAASTGIPESRLRDGGSKVTKSFSLPLDLAEWLRDRAYLDRRPESEFVEEALRQYVERWKG